MKLSSPVLYTLLPLALVTGCIFSPGQDPDETNNGTQNSRNNQNNQTTPNNGTVNNTNAPPNNTTTAPNNATTAPNNATTATNNATTVCQVDAKVLDICANDFVCAPITLEDGCRIDEPCSQGCPSEGQFCNGGLCAEPLIEEVLNTSDAGVPSIDISGDDWILGIPSSDETIGRVYASVGGEVFDSDGDSLDLTPFGAERTIGTAVAIQGDYMVIGAPRATGEGASPGRVGFYNVDGTSTLRAGEDITDTAGTHLRERSGGGLLTPIRFGAALSAGGDGATRVVAIGAPSVDTVVVCSIDGSNCRQLIPADGPSDMPGFGGALAIDDAGRTLVVGAETGNDAEVWEFDDATWSKAELNFDPPDGHIFCGRTVAVSPAGDRVAVACTTANSDGQIHVLRRVVGGPDTGQPGEWEEVGSVHQNTADGQPRSLAIAGPFLFANGRDTAIGGRVRVWYSDRGEAIRIGDFRGDDFGVTALGAGLSFSNGRLAVTGVDGPDVSARIFDIPASFDRPF